MDAITLLKNDHRSVEKLFKRFEHAGEKAYAEKRKLVDRIIEELSQHAAIEEQVFYPVARATVPGTEDIALESLEEHHIVKWVLSELEGMDPHDERFDAKVTVLIENVRHHVEEEESEFFPKVRDRLGRNDLGEVGDALAQAKEGAPTHPHPRSPDSPPANLVTGAAAGVIDKVSDTVSGLAQGGVSVVQDLIARIGHRADPGVGSHRVDDGEEAGAGGASCGVGRGRRRRADGEDGAYRGPFDREGRQVRCQGHGDDRAIVGQEDRLDREAGDHDDRENGGQVSEAHHRGGQARRQPHPSRRPLGLTEPGPTGQRQGVPYDPTLPTTLGGGPTWTGADRASAESRCHR